MKVGDLGTMKRRKLPNESREKKLLIDKFFHSFSLRLKPNWSLSYDCQFRERRKVAKLTVFVIAAIHSLIIFTVCVERWAEGAANEKNGNSFALISSDSLAKFVIFIQAALDDIANERRNFLRIFFFVFLSPKPVRNPFKTISQETICLMFSYLAHPQSLAVSDGLKWALSNRPNFLFGLRQHPVDFRAFPSRAQRD